MKTVILSVEIRRNRKQWLNVNERLAIVREAQRKERYNAALRDDATIPEADKEYEELTRERTL